MKHLLGLAMAMAVLSGCGEENQLNLGHDSNYFGHDGNKEALGSPCGSPFVTKLVQSKNKNSSPLIEFTSFNLGVESKGLAGDATKAQRCDEIRNYLSNGETKVEISFLASEAEKKQMAQGKVINLQPMRASLGYTDGSNKPTAYSVDLNCAEAFSVSCDVHSFHGHSECVSHTVSFPAQSCKFRTLSLPFGFSDLKNTELEIAGELEFSASGGAQIKFKDISWSEAY